MKFILSMAVFCLSFVQNTQTSQVVDLYKQAVALKFKADRIISSQINLKIISKEGSEKLKKWFAYDEDGDGFLSWDEIKWFYIDAGAVKE